MSRSPSSVVHRSLFAALLLMSPFDLLASMGMDVYLPVVPEMPRILGTTPSVVQLTLSLYMVILGAGQLLFGPMSDAIGRRPVLLGGAVTFAVASFLLAGAASAAAFVALRVLQATGAAAALVATFATVRDVYADRPEGAVIYALFGAMLSFVPALGPIAGALLAEHFGWRSIFVLLGALATAATLQALAKWHETRPAPTSRPHLAFGAILRDRHFWTYSLGFSAAMGAFFVFFSTAPRVLIDKAGFSQLAFSLAFASVALVLIATTRFAKGFVTRWGHAGSLRRGMAMLLIGAALLTAGQRVAPGWFGSFGSFWTFVPPMWVIAVGIVLACSVTANGALQAFGHAAGTATALYYCVESLIVGLAGTASVVLLPGDTAWPLVAYASLLSVLTLIFQGSLSKHERARLPERSKTIGDVREPTTSR
ncbi:CmlA/FloR family chloramphenicol efflux MFS transporter [Pendulispora rubella]|uniref:CmlA/FloR family chloramphenicol efflux MFS transporter n=1 Tax=Pendulispora rubella TaxID=2741070 RepID=A0ABZ2KVA9_9BACT